MSSSRTPLANLSTMPVAAFQYRPIVPVAIPSPEPEQQPPAERDEERARLAEEVWQQRIDSARALGEAETRQAIQAVEARLRADYEQRLQREADRISAVLANFDETRKAYFSRVEAEVVRLSLSIAAKILHREAQLDPMLLASLVQIALQQLKEGSSATLFVHPREHARWQTHFDSLTLALTVNVQERPGLDPGDCVLETEMGSVNFNLDKQLKEVENGFFDLLAHKPE